MAQFFGAILFFDLPLEQLQIYLPPRREPADFDSFWQQTLREARSFPLGAKVGLLDEVCPPRTVFAAYNHDAGPKQIRVWEFNHHEGGQGYQDAERLKFVKELWKWASPLAPSPKTEKRVSGQGGEA